MSPPPIPKELVAYLSFPSTSLDLASDALEEWILYRRSKGDTLFDVSLGLAELEEKSPPHSTHAFDRARYLTSIPEPSDLSPPAGVFPLYRSQSPATILNHLLSQPEPTLEHSREVVLEYVLAKETKAREKKHGRGGKGTLGREALEEISARLTEVEAGLMFVEGRKLELEELDRPRQLGMTLILSLRMSLSYFTSRELAEQLLKVPVGTAERILVQHIRRRVAGEGRWGEGKELEYLESLTIPQRPALRPAFRSAKARTLLPSKPIHPVTLPAPGKSTCIKLIQTFSTEGATSPSSYFSRKGFSGAGDSPKSPTSPLPPVGTPSDASKLAAYAQEVLTEFATREKRDYMLKLKWAKNGRDQLSKDLGEMEQALCLLSRQQPSPAAPALVPVFLALRQTFSLPPSALPPKLVDAFVDQVPAPPEADNEPFREPSIQSATGSLYVNPRLDDVAAFEILQELIEYETEMLKEEDDRIDVPSALFAIVESVEKRFPDGSYATAFEKAKRLAVSDGALASSSITKQASTHRRAISSYARPPEDEASPPKPAHLQHSRSTSLPQRRNTMDSATDSDESIGVELTATRSSTDRASVIPPAAPERPPVLPPLSFATPVELELEPESKLDAEPTPPSAGGWWDVVSAVQTQPPPAPWTESFRSVNRTRTTSGGYSSLPLPPGAEPATISQHHEPQLDQIKSIERNSTPSSSNPATPARRGVSLESSPAQSPPLFDYSKRQSATLSGELGSLMISPGATRGMYSPSPPRTDAQDGRSTPRGPPRYHSDHGRPSGSSSRASPSVLHRSQTDIPAVRAQYDSESDSDADDQPVQPTIRHIPQGNQHPMLQTMARPVPPPPAALPNASSPSGGKSKHRGWKSVSAAMGISKDKDRQKEKQKDKENEKVVKTGNKAWPENEPGRWNKDLVANIMGPPADKR